MQHLKDSTDPVMKGILAETELMLAQGKMDLPLSLCFAAARGDDLLLHQLLKRGSNPNETDKNGRTALVSPEIPCTNQLPHHFSLQEKYQNPHSVCIFFCVYVISAYSSIKRKPILCCITSRAWSRS